MEQKCQTTVVIDGIVFVFNNFYQMLNEKTSSANNLRIESSRRHQIRNLRAKVRSMLPEEICPKESKRIHQNHKFQHLFTANHELMWSSNHLERDKRLVKELEKLTVKELEEINENKYYFLGNQNIIEQFDHFVREFHPKIKENQWVSPQVIHSGDLPFGFIPPFYSTQKDRGSRQSLTSAKKRGSTATSVHLQKCESVMNRQVKSQFKHYKEFETNFVERRQAIEEESKVKRQISSVHLHRQQHIASVNRNALLKLRIEKAKVASSPIKVEKYKEKSDLKHAFEEHDVLSLTAKLRKICLKRYKNDINP